MTRRSLAAFACASFAYLLAGHGQAYCLTTTCDARKETCETDANRCNVSGLPLVWPTRIVTWDVQRDGSGKQHISAATLETVVENAFGRWQAVDCGGGQHPSIELVNRGLVSCAKPEYSANQPNANVITFHDAPWPYSEDGAQTNTLALTTVWYSKKDGEIYDANVEINTYGVTDFALQDDGRNSVDLNAVLTHELGHFLGLSHSENHPNATMFTSYDPGMVTLEDDDIAGICASLPPDRVTQAATEPRHGFSAECAHDQGCCFSTIGGKAPPSQALGLWAFGLGVCGWLGRARLKRVKRSAAELPR